MIVSPLDAVRAATAANHRRAEQSFAALIEAFPISYGRYLRAHASAFPAVGRAIAAAMEWQPWEARWRDLLQDLSQLGLTAPEPVAVAVAGSTDEALGMAYVLEGSRMGSAIILKAMPDQAATSYLRGGLDTAPWKQLKARLTAADPAAAPGVIRGAQAAFAAFCDAGVRAG